MVAVLCVDADAFFLSVHQRADASLNDSKPLVLVQYQDVRRPALFTRTHRNQRERQKMIFR